MRQQRRGVCSPTVAHVCRIYAAFLLQGGCVVASWHFCLCQNDAEIIFPLSGLQR